MSIAQAARESWVGRFTLERYHQQMLRAMEAAAGSQSEPRPSGSG
jgi:hypothetical protein